MRDADLWQARRSVEGAWGVSPDEEQGDRGDNLRCLEWEIVRLGRETWVTSRPA